jgi:hypothetical protein
LGSLIDYELIIALINLYTENWTITIPITFILFYTIRWYAVKTAPTYVMYHRKGGMAEFYRGKEDVTTVHWKVDKKAWLPRDEGRNLTAIKGCNPETWIVRGIPRRLFHVVEKGGGSTVSYTVTEEMIKERGKTISKPNSKFNYGNLSEETLSGEHDKSFVKSLIEELKRPRGERFMDIILGLAIGAVLGMVMISQKWIVFK